MACHQLPKGYRRTLAGIMIAGVAGLYGSLGMVMGDYNPLTIISTIKQNIRKANDEKVRLMIKRDKLLRLEFKVLAKAQLNDGEPGLSFRDQAQLARDLGRFEIVAEGADFKFGVTPIKDAYDFPREPEPYLDIGGERLLISEGKLKQYLKGAELAGGVR